MRWALARPPNFVMLQTFPGLFSFRHRCEELPYRTCPIRAVQGPAEAAQPGVLIGTTVTIGSCFSDRFWHGEEIAMLSRAVVGN